MLSDDVLRNQTFIIATVRARGIKTTTDMCGSLAMLM
jgi:hypothetical protein